MGLLPCAQGGSPIRMWDPEQDGALLRNMVSKIRRAGGANAVFWFQGCADAEGEKAAAYERSFANVVSGTRKALGWEIPFYTFQLNKYNANHDSAAWDLVRQAQRLAAKRINNVFILPTADLSLSDEIHLNSASNAALGGRLAMQVLEGMNAPDLEKCEKTDKNALCLRFANVRGELIRTNAGNAAEYLEVRDEEGIVPVLAVKTEGVCVHAALARELRGTALVSYEKEHMRGAGTFRDSLTLLPALPFLYEEIS